MPSPIVEIYAPLMVGAFLTSVLYGVAVMQMYIYYQTSQRDPRWMKLFILYLLLAETTNTILDIGIVFEPLILRYGSEIPTIRSPLLLRADGVMTVLISTPVQLFMAWRIGIIAQSKIPPLVIAAFSFTAMAGGIWTTVSVSLKPDYHQFVEFRAAPTTWLVSSAVTDIVVSCFLVYSLSKKRNVFSDDIITRLIRYNVQTGTITALAALADAIVFITDDASTVFFSWDLCIAKLYSLSLLSSLNARSSAKALKAYEPNPLFNTSEETSASLHFRAPPLMTITPNNDIYELRSVPSPHSKRDLEAAEIYVEQEVFSRRDSEVRPPSEL
ncbi:uncharacterized protein BT62DRAFT_938599 [Guyanagaster necrorhizus]|uniref:DUF6534 domain-containing protein n=1 Tax=Guyanagaster necrorhizus TaxID=856835 RepID=A0A9P7VFU9_9AGAR|nr:uncharacterized protein BT62DRAFT_938599 [Guyanagaster necrorhizus MCA 3950]KAG7439808.1 hypothetical protein BT62DRAFT_938599 [Guyanagaster necrorhizus MCA 3950]